MDALNSAEMVLLGKFRFNQRSRALFHLNTGTQIPIGSRARAVLGVLLERAGDIVPKDEIIKAVWPETVVEDGNLTVHIATLRRVLDTSRLEGSCIQTISGRGYCFVGGVTQNNLNARSGVERREQRAARTPPRLSIVVLPFTNLSNDPEQQYFADGLIEDLTTDLSRIADMLVISRNTAFTYRNKSIDTKQIGRELAVRYVLEGSVRRSGNQLRVGVQLIDAERDTHIWADRFDGDTSNLFALQDEITSRIAITLGLDLVRAEAARSTPHPDALDYLLRGRAARTKPQSRSNFAERIDLFERALVLDPQSIEAQSRLALNLLGRIMDGMTDTAVADMIRAEGLVEQALAASPHSPLVHYAKGDLLRAQRRFDEAIPEYEVVLAANRNWVGALFALGQCKAMTGSIEETIPLMERAIRLSPRDPHLGSFFSEIGRVHLLQSRTDEAILWLEKARDTLPAHPAFRAWLASAHALKGDTDRAATELAEARRLSSGDRFSSIARTKEWYWTPMVDDLLETTFLTGLRKAGMPEE